MRKILFTICVLLGCVRVVNAQQDSYKIEGLLNSTTNGSIVLVADTENGLLELSDATITNGKFEFTGRMPEATVAYLMPVKKNTILATLILENANYTVSLGATELIVEGGGEEQKIWKEFNDLNKYLIQVQQQMNAKAQANPSLIEGLQRELAKIEAKVGAEELELVKKFGDSHVAAYVVAGKMQGMEGSELSVRYEALSEKNKAGFYGKRVAAELEKVMKVALGAIAPNFSAPLAEGGSLSLHETKAKVKVIDFWASWCMPCRGENVNLLKIYKRFRPKGLEIISVSLDDNKRAWLDAIGQDGSNWRNVSDLKGAKSEIAAEYGVVGIPATFILDEENRIVAKNLRGKDLERKIDEMLKKKKKK